MMNLTLNITTPLLIIGAALPRTATTSIAAALEQLGYKVFHATTKTAAFDQIWNEICDAETQENYDRRQVAFGRFVQQLSDDGFNATLDQPSCYVYEDLIKYYPEAKILQTQRDPTSWARSMVEMVYSLDFYFWQPPYNSAWNVTNGPYGYWSKKQLGFRDDEIHPNGLPRNNSDPNNRLEFRSSISLESCKEAYYRYDSKVKQKAPSDKLVSYHPKEGWGPLCENFLPSDTSVNCPDGGKLPHVNSNADGFLLDWRRIGSAKVHLYKIHPLLSEWKWLVDGVVLSMKLRRRFINFILKRFGKQQSKRKKRN